MHAKTFTVLVFDVCETCALHTASTFNSVSHGAITYPSTHTVYQVYNTVFFIILGGYGHTGKWIQENLIFMKFCCCFKTEQKD